MTRATRAPGLLAASTTVLVELAARPVSAEPAAARRAGERARLACGVHQFCCFIASPRVDPLARSPARPSHRAIVGVPIVGETGLPRPVVKRYVQRHADQLASCYPRRLPARPGEGDVGLQLLILPLGKVALIGAVGFDAEVTSCIASVIEAIAFPRADNGDVTHAFVPIAFAGRGLTSGAGSRGTR